VLRRAWRRLWATPIFTVFAVGSVALGVGVTTAIYAVVASLTGSSLAIPHGDRVGLVVGSDPLDGRRLSWRSVISRADLEDLRRTGGAFQDAAVSARFVQSVVAPSTAEVASGEAVTGNYFSLLGLAPSRGRLIQPGDDAAPSRIAVLGYHYWRTRFGGDPGALGQILRIGGEPFEIVGVGPQEFSGLTDRIQSATAVFVPFGSTTMFPNSAAPPEDPTDRRRRQLSVLVPLATDDATSQLAEQARAVGKRLDAAFPIDMRLSPDAAPQRIARAWSVRSIEEASRQADRAFFARSELMVLALVALVLVVACTNLANLVLARASGRHYELTVRRALGAPRLRLVLEELVETGILAALGAAGAFVIGRTLIVWFSGVSLPVSQAMVIQLEPNVTAATLFVASGSVLASLAVFGLAPALQITRDQLRPSLSTDGGTGGHFQWRARRRLISLQVAISLSFFLIAAFAVRIVLGERTRASGIDVDRLAVGVLNLRLPPWDETSSRAAVDRLLALTPSQPDIESLAVTSGMPFGTTFTPIAGLSRPDQPDLPGRKQYVHAMWLTATPSVFRTFGVGLVRGRGFTEHDVAGTDAVAVLSEHTAHQVFGTADPVGRQMLLRNVLNMTERDVSATLTVIGVAADTDTQHRYSRDIGTVYVPLAQHFEPLLTIAARTTGDPSRLGGSLRALAQRADPDLVVDRPLPAALVVTGAYVLVDVVSRVAGGLAVLALVLSMAGLFGVLSHLVSRRTREMGLRMALGADPGRIRRLILGDGLRPVFVGIGIGWVVGLLVRLLLRAAYDTALSGTDLIVFGLAPLPILAAAAAACYWPARRASRVAPNEALREL
jgi:putative ABC transport system permease protein